MSGGVLLPSPRSRLVRWIRRGFLPRPVSTHQLVATVLRDKAEGDRLTYHELWTQLGSLNVQDVLRSKRKMKDAVQWMKKQGYVKAQKIPLSPHFGHVITSKGLEYYRAQDETMQGMILKEYLTYRSSLPPEWPRAYPPNWRAIPEEDRPPKGYVPGIPPHLAKQWWEEAQSRRGLAHVVPSPKT